jgi:8-oxo-dGTP pyrophosphatase MutT (NUDIX family)
VPAPSRKILQAAALPYRFYRGRLEVLMITRREGRRWVVPKGHVEPGETPRQSARREASEEAGLEGRLGRRPIGRYAYLKKSSPCTVLVFLMRVERERRRWREEDERVREWLELEEAIERARHRGLRLLLQNLPRALLA